MLQFLKNPDIEGVAHFFYLDSKGNITVGVGHMVPNKVEFMGLDLYTDADGRFKATTEQKEKLWKTLNTLKKEYVKDYQHHGPGTYRKDEINGNSILYMTSDEINKDARKLINKEINAVLKDTYFCNIEYSPFEAQIGILDMVYNVGLHRLIQKFPNFRDAVHKFDWMRAVKECHRSPPVSEARNKAVIKLFHRAAQEEDKFREFTALSARPRISRIQ